MDVGARQWSLLASYAAAYGVEFQAGVLGGFDGAADGFTDEAGDFDAALLYVEYDCAARREFGVLGRHGLWRGLRGVCHYSGQWLAYCRLDYVWRACARFGIVRGGLARTRLRLRRFGDRAGHFCGFERLARMVGCVVAQIFVFYFRLRQKQLVLGRQRQIVRHVEVFEDLLRDAAEHGRGNLATLMESDRGIENHRNYNLRIVQWR